MAHIRIFIAIEIPEPIKEKIAKLQEDLKAYQERVSWTKPGNIHLTLKFLGNVEQSRIPAVAGAVNKIAEQTRPFSLHVQDVGVFPNIKRPRIIWVGVTDLTAGSSALAGRLDLCLSDLGFQKERRKFSPHLTIGRIKAIPGAEFLGVLSASTFAGGDFMVEEIAVIKSDLKPGGAVYTPLRKVNLGINLKPEGCL
ncbi:MAG: RNA 2',3'-cyclic phosphodiesterase [bacterium]